MPYDLSDLLDLVGTGFGVYGGMRNLGLSEDMLETAQQQSAIQAALANRLADYATANVRLPTGDYAYYRDGERGIDLTPRSQELLDLQQALEKTNVQQRQREGGAAGTFLNRAMETSPYDVKTIQAAMERRGLEGLRKGFESSDLAMQRILGRRGSGVDKEVLTNVGRERGEAVRGVYDDATVRAPQIAEALESSRLERTLNPALQLGSSASNRSGFTDVNTSGSALAQALQASGTQGLYGAGKNAGDAGDTSTSAYLSALRFGGDPYGTLGRGIRSTGMNLQRALGNQKLGAMNTQSYTL